MDNNDLVTIEEFKKQVWEIERVKVEINVRDIVEYPAGFSISDRLVRPYKYDPLPDNATVDDLQERIDECTKPFIYFITPDGKIIPSFT